MLDLTARHIPAQILAVKDGVKVINYVSLLYICFPIYNI